MTSVKDAFEARQKRRIAANPTAAVARYLHNHKPKKLRIKEELTPEEKYQEMKEAWYFHESSWYMRHDNGYDGYGCSEFGCVPECKYYYQYTTTTTTTIPKKKVRRR